MSAPFFSKDAPDKIGDGIDVSGKNTLIKTDDISCEFEGNTYKTEDNNWRHAIAVEPIDAKIDGKKFFCVRVDNSGESSQLMIGFTPMEEFDSSRTSGFGHNGFTGCGMDLNNGYLWYPDSEDHNIIDWTISNKAKEIIVILTISNNGKKKEIRFLCDGKETESSDVSELLKADLLFPAICLKYKDQRITTIPIDQLKTRTPDIENLIKEYEEQNDKTNNQSGGAVASFSAAMIQLQKELDEALQKIAALSSELQQEKQKTSDLENELQKLKEQNQK
jgi:hypothetical protein